MVGERIKHISKVANETASYIEDRASGKIKSIKTCWASLNEAGLNGLEIPSIVLCAGMSGVGKTLIAGQLQKSISELNPDQECVILCNNFEMLAKSLLVRDLTKDLNLNYKEILSADRPLSDENIALAVKLLREKYSKYEIYFVDSSQTVTQMQDNIVNLYNRTKKTVINITDHTILTKRSVEGSQLEMLHNLFLMQIEVKKAIPCIFFNLSQLNRDIEDQDRRSRPGIMNYPVKSDIYGADSGYIASDIVIVAHRPSLLHLPFYGPSKVPVEPNDIYFHYMKTRNSEPFIKKMYGDYKSMQIVEV